MNAAVTALLAYMVLGALVIGYLTLSSYARGLCTRSEAWVWFLRGIFEWPGIPWRMYEISKEDDR